MVKSKTKVKKSIKKVKKISKYKSVKAEESLFDSLDFNISPPTSRPIIITVGNGKGGVGKSLVAVNLAAYLLELLNRWDFENATSPLSRKRKVLLVDCDFQANSSQHLNVFSEGIHSKRNLYEGIVTGDRTLKEAIISTEVEGLDMISSNFDLCKFNEGDRLDSELRSWLRKKYLENYDYVIIDSRPEVGKLTANIMVATDFYIVPLMLSPTAVMGLSIMLRLINKIQTMKQDNYLKFLGVVYSIYDSKSSMQKNNYKPFMTDFLKKANIPVLGCIPSSQAVLTSIDSFLPLTHSHKSSKLLPIQEEFYKFAGKVINDAQIKKGRVAKAPIIESHIGDATYLRMTKGVSKENPMPNFEVFDDFEDSI